MRIDGFLLSLLKRKKVGKSDLSLLLLSVTILDIIRNIHNRHTEFLCVLIAFIRIAIITLDIDDHHIAVLGKPFVAFSYRRFVMTLPIGRDNNAIIRLLYNIQVRHGIRFDKRKLAPLLPFSSESSDGLCGKFVKLAVSPPR